MIPREQIVAYIVEEVREGRLSAIVARRIIDKMWELEQDPGQEIPYPWVAAFPEP